MAEPKKPTGATQQAGPEEPTRYIEQQPMGAEGEGEEYIPSFDYVYVEPEPEEGEEVGGQSFDYVQVEEVAEGEEYVPTFDYVQPA
jgi:hypothetical protein